MTGTGPSGPGDVHILGRRLVAFIVDATLHLIVLGTVFAAIAERVDGTAVTGDGVRVSLGLGASTYLLEGGAATAFVLFVLGLAFLHLGAVQGRTGATLGKRLVGLRVVDAQGAVCGVGRATVRWLFWLVDSFPYLIPGLLGFVVAASTPSRQRVGDQVARTFVVKEGSLAGSGDRTGV